MSTNKLVVVCSLTALVGSLAALPAVAQEKSTAPAAKVAVADSIEEVIVTARRKEEKMQDVPISVTVLSGESLAAKGITNIMDLQRSIPNMHTFSSGQMVKGFSIGIRGVRFGGFLMFDDAPVSTYFAEGVLAHPWGFGDTFFDIQSVQVLKGPQGTLFGRNTTGGAILVEPNKASLDEGFGGSAKVTLGDYNLQQFDGVVNIPLNDVAALRIAGEHKKRDGYTTNVLSGQKLDDVGNDAIRISLLLKPTKDITSHTIYDYLHEKNAPNNSQPLQVFGPSVNGIFGGTLAQWNRLIADQQARGPWKVASVYGTNTAQDLHSPRYCTPGDPLYNPVRHCRKHMTPQETLDAWGLLNNTQIDFDGFTLKNIIAYHNMRHLDENSESFPGSGNPIALSIPGAAGGSADQNNKMSQWSEELQILGKAFDNRLDWQGGLFAFREWGAETSPSYTQVATWSVTQGYGWNQSRGIFGQGTYAVTDQLKATVGVRRNWDTRNATDTALATNGTTCQVRVGNTAQVLSRNNCELNGEHSTAANTWSLGLDYKVMDDTLLYLTHSKGYKAGGFSIRTHRAAQFAYDPEFITNTEVGVKSDWSLFDRPIRTNLAVFNEDYTNQQVQLTNAGTVPVTTYVANAGKSKIQGFELEVTYKPTQRVELSGFLSYAHPRYLTYSTPASVLNVPVVVDVSGRRFAYPLREAGLSASWQLPFDSSVGTVTARGDLTLKGQADVDNSAAGLIGLNPPAVTTAQAAVAGFTQPANAGYGQLNLRVDWARPFGNPVDLGFFVTNVSNKPFIMGSSGVNGLSVGVMSPPRMYGFELSYKFGEGFKPKD